MSAGWRFSEDDTPLWEQRFERALPFIIGIPLLLTLAALIYFASIAARQQQQALIDQQRSYEIVALAQRLDGSVAKAESMLARYVISMDKDIGRLYQERWRKAGSELAALRRATRNDPLQQKRLNALVAAYDRRGETLNDIALRISYDQKEAALGKFYQASTDDELKRIAALLDGVIENEKSRLLVYNNDVVRAGASVAQVAKTYRLVGLVLLATILLSLWIARSAMRERRAEQRLIEEEYRRADLLELAVAERTAELELAYAHLKQETADREKVEASLRQMQKMEAVGQLTGGIAHDFNNMLAVVVGGLELARRKVEGEDDVIRHIDNAMEGAKRASMLTRRLLTFARAEPHLPATLEPDDLIRDMVELLDRSIGDQIRVVLELDAGDWRVYADRHQMENAVLNLAVNARDAMNGRGTLTLRTSQRRLRAHEINGCAPGEYLCLSVKDTGCGMTPEVLERVFEPFFTTKDVGKGTGLGLSQIFGFMGQCGGEIEIISTVGEGTEVRLFFPRHHTKAGLGDSEQPALLAARGNGAPLAAPAAPLSILVVEDDPRVLAQTRSALQELGHKAICCDHPFEAVPLLEQNPGVDLILSDVLMPDQTGPEMIAALPKPYRSIPVLFVTGYAGDIADNSLFKGRRLLRKPYTLSALRVAIAEAISERPVSRAAVAAARSRRSRESAAARAG